MVVTHAGVGTVMQLLEWGVHPVVLVRSAGRGEHVDDHQSQIAAVLSEHGLATVADPRDLVAADLHPRRGAPGGGAPRAGRGPPAPRAPPRRVRPA